MAAQIITSLILISGILFLAFNIPITEMGIVANMNALLIVLGGTLSATLLVYPWRRLIWTISLLKKAFQNLNQNEKTIETIVAVARTYRVNGIRAALRSNLSSPGMVKKTATHKQILTVFLLIDLFHVSR